MRILIRSVAQNKFFRKHFSAIIFLLLAAFVAYALFKPKKDPFHKNTVWPIKAITRGDSTKKTIALVFTAHDFGDGLSLIAATLRLKQINASFFLTGDFYRNEIASRLISELKRDGNYLGSHSDKHLLYCDWTNRDSLLVTKQEFTDDLLNSYRELKNFGVEKNSARYFLPPYEWYNDSITSWAAQLGLQLVNFTPGTRSTADYTYPDMGSKYMSNEMIYQSIIKLEKNSPSGLNGFILLIHAGTDPRRKEKFYYQLPSLIDDLKRLSYSFVTIDQLLEK